MKTTPMADRNDVPPFFLLPPPDVRRAIRTFKTYKGAARALARLVRRTSYPWRMVNGEGHTVARSAVYSDGTTYVQFRKLDLTSGEATWE